MKVHQPQARLATEASEKETYRPPALIRRTLLERCEHFSALAMPTQAIVPRGAELPRSFMRIPRGEGWS